MEGQQIGRYRINREIGRGAMGIVYAALDPVIGRTVAIKTIHFAGLSEGTNAPELRDRLRREAQAAGILSHPGIVTIHDIGNEGDEAYIVMEYVDGRTLEEVFASGIPQHTTVLLGVLKKAAEALDYAHSRGIVHRDIKPSNIMVAKDGSVKIADFGVAKFSASTSMTQTGFVLGTPNYMSPEQAQARTLDGRSDQFSLAVLAYRVLTGMLPFTAPTLTAVLTKLLWEQPEFAQTGLHPTLQSVLAKALAKDPSQRYATCVEFVTQLEKGYAACRPDVPPYEEQFAAPADKDPAEQTYLIPAGSRDLRGEAIAAADTGAYEPAAGLSEPPAGNEDETATSFTGMHNYTQPAAAPLPPPPPPAPITVAEEEPGPAAPRGRVRLVIAAAAVVAVAVFAVGYMILRRAPVAAVPATPAGQISSLPLTAKAPPDVPPAVQESSAGATAASVPAVEPPAPPPVKKAEGSTSRSAAAKKAKPSPAPPIMPPPPAPVLQAPAVTLSETPPPAPKPAPPPAPAPANGEVRWTGRLPKNAVLVINATGASFGNAIGVFPGMPIKVEIEPATVTVRERPGPQNGWKQVMLYSGSERYSSITIHWTALQ